VIAEISQEVFDREKSFYGIKKISGNSMSKCSDIFDQPLPEKVHFDRWQCPPDVTQTIYSVKALFGAVLSFHSIQISIAIRKGIISRD
jgi:hypothetical protein